MSRRLAIFSHHIGALSETFIRRYIESFWPENTVVVSYGELPEKAKSWTVNCPAYIIKRPADLFSKGTRFFRRKMGMIENAIIQDDGLKDFLFENKVDILWGHYLNLSWPLVRFASETGLKLFVHGHGFDVSTELKKPLWQKRYADYQNASGVIVVNRLMRERLTSLGVPSEKIHVISCGVDVPRSLITHEPKAKIKCLAVGRMVGKKAPIKLLEAFRMAAQKEPTLHLDFIGTGPLLKKAQRYVDAHGMTGQVTMHGGQPHEIVMKFMQKADLFLQHSLKDPRTGDEEGMPVSILEAMAYGLPVVSTRHAGIPEAVEHGVSGYLVEEGDVRGMARYILELGQKPEKRASMGQSGWERAQKRFSWQVERDKLFEVMGLKGELS